MINTPNLEAIYGSSLKPKELAEFLGLDQRTVIKYAGHWGGVEVTPGTWRFFEKRILEVLNAEQSYEKRHSTIQSKRDGSGTDATKAVPGREQKVLSGGSDLGKRSKKGIGEEVIPDKFGVFSNRLLVK